MSQYKTLTKDDVQTVLLAYLVVHDTTTNLDIKKQLRIEGFYATQKQVSDFTDEIYVEGSIDNLDFDFNGTYRTYYLYDANDSLQDADEDEEYDEDEEDGEEEEDDNEEEDDEKEDDEEEDDEEEDDGAYRNKIASWRVFDKDEPSNFTTIVNVTRNVARYVFAQQHQVKYFNVRAHLC